MTVSARGGGSSPFQGQDVLREMAEFRAMPQGLNDGDNVGVPITGISRYNNAAAQAASIMTNLAGSAPVTLRTVDGRRCFDWSAGAAFNGQSVLWVFRPNAAGQPLYADMGPLTFHTTDPTYIPSNGRDDVGYALEMTAFMRKRLAGDGSDCRFCFGIANNRTLGPSRRTCWAGLVGDGAGGYRFGSVNCPDSFLGGAANNNPGDIDANSQQPPSLVAPGVNWWKVRIKVVPPTLATPGRWAGYYNNGPAFVFDQQANMPRGHQGVSDNNSLIELTIHNLQGDTAGLNILTPQIDLLTFRITDDLTL